LVCAPVFMRNVVCILMISTAGGEHVVLQRGDVGPVQLRSVQMNGVGGGDADLIKLSYGVESLA